MQELFFFLGRNPSGAQLMTFDDFVRQSGFKVLSTAKLESCEFSLIMYLMNCSHSGLDQIVSTESELASLIGFEQQDVIDCIESLSVRNIVRVKYKANQNMDHPSLRIGMDYDVTKWNLDNDEDKSGHHQDAVVFPFRRREGAALHLVEKENHQENAGKKKATWKRVFDSYALGRSLDDRDITQAEESAKVLVETHPVDQVLLMIRHFELRIPTLSLLASSWQHYQEMFEEETQKVDLLGARQKHQELDQAVRDEAQKVIDQADELELNEEERNVLQILIKHRHPRRQLFWAYQTRNRYPNLHGFFADNASMMLAVTSSGAIVKKSTPKDSDD